VFIFCVSVGVINRIQNAITNTSWFWLSVCDALVSPLQGFLNSIVYGMNKRLRLRWYEVLTCKKWSVKDENNENRPLNSKKNINAKVARVESGAKV